MRQAWLSGIVVALWLLFVPWATADVAVPPLKARVTDLTGTFQPSQRAALEQTLQTFEERKGSQIAVLIVPTTQPETIEQYAIRVAESWKLGRKGVDDGVLLLIAKDDRKLRIEVGYGLEGAIPDAVAKRIISEIISPRFKKGDFYGGISAGVERLIKVIEGEPLPRKKKTRSRYDFSSGSDLMGLAFVIAVIGVMRALFGQFVGGLIAGLVAAVIAWLLSTSAMVALGAGVVVFLFTLFGRIGGSGGWSSGGGWSGGGGGGFSGGGGGFGGGGASGGW